MASCVQDLIPGKYLADDERFATMDEQLSAPRRQADSSTPQPEEPLEINMPTPAVNAGAAAAAAATPVDTPAAQPPAAATVVRCLLKCNSK